MTGLEILLAVYVTGWLGTSVYGYKQCSNGTRITNGECAVIAGVSGAIWPAMAVMAVKEKIQGE